MKENELRISIIGNSAVGKSTMMFEIYNLLTELGFEVELPPMSKENCDDYASNEIFIEKMLDDREERLTRVRNKTKITLREFQAYWDVKETDVKPEDAWKKTEINKDN